MVRPVNRVAVWPFRAADSGLPSGLKRSTRTVRLLVPAFIKTSSVAQPPLATNCGNKTAPGPPTVFAVSRKGNTPALPERFVTGSVLKLEPRNLRPITDTGRLEEPAEVIANVPVNSV